MSCTVASRRLKSFNRQQVSRRALIKTWSTSFGCSSMNRSTSAIPRYTFTGLRRLLPSPNVFISMRDTVNLSVVTPRRCMSSNALQASSTPLRRIMSSSTFADPPFGLDLSEFLGLILSTSRAAPLPPAPPAPLRAPGGVARAGVATVLTLSMPSASCSVFSSSSTALLSSLPPGIWSPPARRCSPEKHGQPPGGGACMSGGPPPQHA
mmetsp:Transcript_40744/g.93776  ORF Transcript_40744/g.93776 Transcript_40744/m.93776 type:complete len:208 (-) Transcript_40744:828-1451(-)